MPRLSDRDYETLAGFRYELRKFVRYSERAAGETFVPGKLLVRREGAPKILHLLVADKHAEGAAFVCRRQRCEAPARDAAELKQRLSG